MSDCYAMACKTCRQSLWVGQGDYIYTVEPERTLFAEFLYRHRGDPHVLAFDNTQEFIYDYTDIQSDGTIEEGYYWYVPSEPDGYNDLREPQPVQIDDDGNAYLTGSDMTYDRREFLGKFYPIELKPQTSSAGPLLSPPDASPSPPDERVP